MNVLVKIIIICIVSLVGFQAEAQSTHSLTVNVDAIDSNKGYVYLALYDSENEFLSEPLKSLKREIEANACQATFTDIPSGIYAVSIFHDENANGKLDNNFFGIPKEDYGCSNDARGFMGPPKWKDAKFELKENKSITITL